MEILPISSLNHFGYCPRSAGLILIDGVFVDNAYTVEGSLGHHVVDGGGTKVRGVRKARYDVDLYSDRLGLVGPTRSSGSKGTRILDRSNSRGRPAASLLAQTFNGGCGLPCWSDAGRDVRRGHFDRRLVYSRSFVASRGPLARLT